MTKRQLMKFLEQKQEEALNSAKKAYDGAKENYKIQLEKHMKMNEVAKKISMLISQADDTLDEWLQYLNEHPELEVETVNNYGCLKSKLNDFVTDSNIKGYMYKHMHDVSKQKSQLETRYNQVKDGIASNYTNVIANVQQLKDAKLGVQYLTELGFDLTALPEEDKNPMTTTLSVAVDTSFLFIQGVKGSED